MTVTDSLPAGLSPASASGDGWSCSISGSTVSCVRADALTPGASWPQIVIAVNVSASAATTVNVASLAGGGDQTAADNTVSDPTTILTSSPDLTVAKAHTDPFAGGEAGESYRITVANAGTAATSAEVVVTDDVPAGLVPAAASGAGWSCAIAAQIVTCRRSDALAPGARTRC